MSGIRRTPVERQELWLCGYELPHQPPCRRLTCRWLRRGVRLRVSLRLDERYVRAAEIDAHLEDAVIDGEDRPGLVADGTARDRKCGHGNLRSDPGSESREPNGDNGCLYRQLLEIDFVQK